MHIIDKIKEQLILNKKENKGTWVRSKELENNTPPYKIVNLVDNRSNSGLLYLELLNAKASNKKEINSKENSSCLEHMEIISDTLNLDKEYESNESVTTKILKNYRTI